MSFRTAAPRAVERRPRRDRHAEPLGRELGEPPQLARLHGDARREPGLAAGVLQHGAQAAVARERDHRLVAQRGERHGPPRAQRVVAADAQRQRLRRDHAARGSGAAAGGASRRAPRRPRRCRAPRAAARCAARRPRCGSPGARGGTRRALRRSGRRPGRTTPTRRLPSTSPRREAIASRPRSAAASAARACGRRASPARGQPDAALVAVEQRLAELALEAADLRAHRRLGDATAGRPRA